MSDKLYKRLAETLAWEPTEPFAAVKRERLKKLQDLLPSGSGFDSGTQINDATRPDRLVLDTAFHHLSEHGYYTGWTEHSVIVTPSLVSGFDLRITGRNRNNIKDYIAEEFDYALRQDVPELS